MSLTNDQNAHDVLAYGYADVGQPQGGDDVQSEVDRFGSAQIATADASRQFRLTRGCTSFSLTQTGGQQVTITLVGEPARDGQTDVVVQRLTLRTAQPRTLYTTSAITTAGDLGLQVSVTAPEPSITEAKRLLMILIARAARLPHDN